MDNSVNDAAVEFHRRGWVPVPILKAKTKGPTAKGWQLTRFNNEDEVAEAFTKANNIGLLTGSASGNLMDVDLDCDEAARLAPVFLPPTPMMSGRADSSRGHRFYRVDKVGKTTKLEHGGKAIVELRGDNLQTLVHPSIHPDGEQVRWVGPTGDYIDAPGEPAACTYDMLLAGVKMIAAITTLARLWNKNGRHNFALAVAGALLRSGRSVDEVKSLITFICGLAGDDELEDRLNAVDDTAKKIENGEPTTGWTKLKELIADAPVASRIQTWLELRNETVEVGGKLNIDLSEVGLSERFVSDHKGLIAYTPGVGWLYYDGRKWAADSNSSRAYRAAIQTLKCLLADVKGMKPTGDDDSDSKAKMLKAVRKLHQKHVIDAMLGLAQRDKDIVIDADGGGNEFLLNCENGVLNVVTGHLASHDPNLKMLNVIGTEYDESATCPEFEKFIAWMSDDDPALARDIQKAVGYSLTGVTSSQAFFVLTGNGANGKTVFAETMLALFGDYGASTDVATFLSGDSGQGAATPDVARLRSKRFVSASEFPAGARFSEERLKRMSGNQTMTARNLYKDPIQFKPSFKLWVDTNHLPAAIDPSNGFWRRAKVFPCTNQISDEDRDVNLQDKLRAELPGILNWALAGAQVWSATPAFDNLSERAQAEHEQYRDDNDYVKQFVSECCDDSGMVFTRKLYKAYAQWAKDGGQHQMSEKMFSARLKMLGYEKKVTNQGSQFRGISLRNGGDGYLMVDSPYLDDPKDED